jgi:hypothetical protein
MESTWYVDHSLVWLMDEHGAFGGMGSSCCSIKYPNAVDSSAFRKVARWTSDEVNDFFLSIYLILPAPVGPGIYSACNIN